MTNQSQHTFIESSIGLSFSMQPSYSMKDGVTDYPLPKGWGGGYAGIYHVAQSPALD